MMDDDKKVSENNIENELMLENIQFNNNINLYA